MPGNHGRCASWLAHTAWTTADLFHSEFLPSGGLPKGMKSNLQLRGMGGESSSAASQPSTPCMSLPHHLLISGGRGAKDSGSRPTIGTFSSLVSDFDYLIGKQKEVLSCHLQSVLAKCSRLPMLLSTGTAAGSCSLWVLTPGEPAFAPSEKSAKDSCWH